MKLNVERTIKKDFELTNEEIATLKKTQEIIYNISEAMKEYENEQEFDIYLKNKNNEEETTSYDLDEIKNTIENLLNSEIGIDEY